MSDIENMKLIQDHFDEAERVFNDYQKSHNENDLIAFQIKNVEMMKKFPELEALAVYDNMINETRNQNEEPRFTPPRFK